MTFRSSAWGARHAFNALNGGFARLGCRQYPIVTLATARRVRSGNVVIDPVFRVCGWTPVESILSGGAVAALPTKESETPRALPQGKVTVTSGGPRLAENPPVSGLSHRSQAATTFHSELKPTRPPGPTAASSQKDREVMDNNAAGEFYRVRRRRRQAD